MSASVSICFDDNGWYPPLVKSVQSPRFRYFRVGLYVSVWPTGLIPGRRRQGFVKSAETKAIANYSASTRWRAE